MSIVVDLKHKMLQMIATEGDRVQLQRLASQPNLNGACGSVLTRKGDRLVVHLEKSGKVCLPQIFNTAIRSHHEISAQFRFRIS